MKGRKFSFSQEFRKLPEHKRNLLKSQLDHMEAYLYALSHRIELELEPVPEAIK